MSAGGHEGMQQQREILIGQARGRFGKLPPDLIAQIVLEATERADWPVRKAAFDALARRYGFAKRDGLTLIANVRVLGDQQTKSAAKHGGTTPYRTRILSLNPARTSCSCPDFVRSGLGLCKHGMVVLEALLRKANTKHATKHAMAERVALCWEPRAPLGTDVDRLARLSFDASAASRTPRALACGRIEAQTLADPNARARLLRQLLRACETGTLSAEPAVPTLLREELMNAERRVDGEQRVRQCMSTTRSLLRALYPYQHEGLEKFLRAGRLLLGDDMGLGKTTQAIAACHALFTSKRVARGLLVETPPS